jgi:hypothetical protein
MAGDTGSIGRPLVTFGKSKGAKARRTLPVQGQGPGIFLSRMVTFLTIVW